MKTGIDIKAFYELKKIEIEIKKLDNLSNAYSKKVGEQKNYMTLMPTITFGPTSANTRIPVGLIYTNPEKYFKLLKIQYDSLMHFIKKLRKTKHLKNPIHYFAAFELQSKSDNLHTHMHLATHEKDLQGFINFIYWYKQKKFDKSYLFPIGRVHIGLSSVYKNFIENKLKIKLEPKPAKIDPTRIEYYMPYLETRIIDDGDATFWEFMTVNDLKERYNENILNYIKKTIVSQIDLETFKTGVAKNWTSYNVKTILKSIEKSKFKRDVEIVRTVGQVYTFSHSTFALKYRLYQDNYSK